MSDALIPVEFHGQTLFVFEHDQQPCTPMRQIVEALGLAWQVQHRKLIARAERFCVTIMVMQIPGDDQARRTLVMPVRKLAGWLMTIHPAKVKPELRDTVLAYQRECDEVLWQHWQARHALEHQVAGPSPDDAAAGGALPFSRGARGKLASVDSALLREFRLVSLPLAQAYLVECGVTPMMVQGMLEGMPALPGVAPPPPTPLPHAMHYDILWRRLEKMVFKDQWYYYAMPEIWPSICEGYDADNTLEKLRRKGHLLGTEGDFYRHPKDGSPISGRKLYRNSKQVFNGEA